MVNTIKYFVYIICCAVVVLGLAGSIGSNGVSNQTPANVFEWEKPVNVFFWNDDLGSRQDCDVVFAVPRKVLNAETLGPGALDQLLKGPNLREEQTGYSTAIPEDVLLQKFEVVSGTAYVDFSKEFSRVAGSCRVRAVRAQIESTLLDLPDINQVVLSVDGQTEGILEP